MTAEETRHAAAKMAEFDRRFEELQQRFEALQARVSQMEARQPSASESSWPATSAPHPASTVGWQVQSRLLARLAAVSFALVVALVLRTLTDVGLVGKPLGVLLGMSYAAGLIALGWFTIVRNRFGQRVFPACGIVLMCALVAETHARFGYLSAPAANLALLAVLAAVTGLGRRYRVAAIVEIATVATLLTGLAVDFPNPSYHLVTALLVMAAVAAFAVQRDHPWLQWFAVGFTLLFLGIWSFQLNALPQGTAPPPELLRSWFLPALLALFATWLLLSVRLALRAGNMRLFALVLPALNVIACFAAAAVVMLPWLAMPRLLGTVGLGVAGLNLLLARWIERHSPAAPAPAAATAFALAATAAFVPAAGLVCGGLPMTLLSWSVAATLLGFWSGRNGSAGLRLVSYALQAGAIVVAVAAGTFAAPAPDGLWAAAIGGLLALLAWAHYRGSRRVPLPSSSWYVRADASDRGGVILLWVSLLALFGGLRVVVHAGTSLLTDHGSDVFAAAQSVLINLLAITLMGSGLRFRSKEQLATGILVAAVGGLKVFASDLITCEGVPLVLSVFSFGVVTAVGSVVLGRWHRELMP